MRGWKFNERGIAYMRDAKIFYEVNSSGVPTFDSYNNAIEAEVVSIMMEDSACLAYQALVSLWMPSHVPSLP